MRRSGFSLRDGLGQNLRLGILDPRRLRGKNRSVSERDKQNLALSAEQAFCRAAARMLPSALLNAILDRIDKEGDSALHQRINLRCALLNVPRDKKS
jgi:hypothetical protein